MLGDLLELSTEPNEKCQDEDWAKFREQVRIGLRAKGIETPGDG